jgi:hypothetical protein
MELMLDRFPVFEANQVLMNGHLNNLFIYPDQQTRLTRSHLIGIGIVCGLDIKLDTTASTAIHLSKGCGVTSEGYLTVEPDDVTLVAYRNYSMPSDLDYPALKDPATNTQYSLSELFPAGEPNTTLLDSPANFLDDKAVLLFLELKKQGLRNCSPNNCDDKGAEVTANVRRLLITIADLDKIIAAAKGLGGGLTSSDVDAALAVRLNLPDLRLRRFDVLNSKPTTSGDVYAGFLSPFRAANLAHATGNALNAAYAAFRPLLQAAYPTSPFTNFNTNFGFLDSAPTNTTQVRFLQYYFDLFDDLVRAYDEFRWHGAELICACCPPDDIFPRHLMLGLAHPEKATQPGRYRQGFLPSPAVGDCANETKELLQLFARLVELTARFTNAPSIPKADNTAHIDPQIRVTPSTLGDRPLATKAIPYYYEQNGTPPLYRLWSGEKTRRNRANQNLSYRFDEYSPPAPAFVSDPLRYDLEPYNFLRVEGHLGKGYQHVLTTLLLLKSQCRLPIDIIALRTGAYDDTQPVDLSQETARFQDLETLYDTLREELLSSLTQGVRQLYDAPVAGLQLPGGPPQLPLLKKYAPSFGYSANTVGAWYEKYLNLFQSRPYIDVEQNKIDPDAVFSVYCVLFSGTTRLPNENSAHAVSVYYISKLSEILPASLDALAYADFENKYQDLLGLIRFLRSDAIQNIASDLKSFVPQEELIDLWEEILFNCKLDPIKAVHDEYVRRIGELKKRQFLANFLALHPGVQHKAGVPLGGTFIIVYHYEPSAPHAAGRDANIVLNVAGRVRASHDSIAADPAVVEAIRRIGGDQVLAHNPDIRLVLGSLIGDVPIRGVDLSVRGLGDAVAKIIAAAVGELPDGTVIADFFLPYRVSCDCPGTQYVLPKPTPKFTTKIGCANADGIAPVTVEVTGGVAPYEIAVDGAGYQALSGPLPLQAGTRSLTVRDAEGTETTAQSITVPLPIAVGEPTYECTEGRFTATFTITGGTPPYTINGQAISQDSFTTEPAASGASVSVEVVDSNACSAKAEFTHVCPPPCNLPCDGIALRRGYRFWLPDPDPNNPYNSFKLDRLVFSVESAPGRPVDLTGKIGPILRASRADLTPTRFPRLVGSWMDKINKIIASEPLLSEAGKADWLSLGYEATAPGRLGVLWIEYFECLKFDIQIASTVAFVQRDRSESVTVAYVPGTTTILAGDTKTEVPQFDGTKTDKCNPDKPSENLCPEPPNIPLKIAQSARGMTVKFDVTPNNGGLVFVWEAQDGMPAIGNGASFTTVFASAGPKLVTVTAFTKAGCTATQSVQVTVG